MKGSRHPVTDSGLENLVTLISENLARGRRAGESVVRNHGRETVYGRRTQKVEIIFPKDRTEGYYSYRAELNLDLEKKLPIRVRIYDWDDMLVESYGYEDVRLDAGLTEADFDPENPEYRF
jgi:negative regulator of sigma E activity